MINKNVKETQERVEEFLNFLDHREDLYLETFHYYKNIFDKNKVSSSLFLDDFEYLQSKELSKKLEEVSDIKDEIISDIKDWIDNLKSKLLNEDNERNKIRIKRTIKDNEGYILLVNGI